MLLPCENDQAKLDHFSRLACSTNLSKILKSGPPKRRPLDRGPGFRRGVLELVALTDFLLRISAPKTALGVFYANLLKLPEIDFQVNDDVSPGCLVYNEHDPTGKTQQLVGKFTG